MKEINFKKTVHGSTKEVVAKLTEALKAEGFGVLTRIDLDSKLKEELNKDIPSTIILGTCNPELAYEAFKTNANVAGLLPCNVVVREIAPYESAVELARPSLLMDIIEDEHLSHLGRYADTKLNRVLDSLH